MVESMTKAAPGQLKPAPLLGELRTLIEQARQQAAATVNAGLTLLYWRIGQRIHQELLQGERAAYGQETVATLSRQLSAEYGRGFAEKNLRRMVQFAQAYPQEEIVVTLLRQLSWSHFLALLPLEKPLQRDFYVQMCRLEGWSVRTLRDRIDSMLFERTALSKQPEGLIAQELTLMQSKSQMVPSLVLKDPYLLDFLGLQDHYLERDLEDAILRELENFLLELGAGFTFIARQKRIQLDSEDFYIDLLLYNRKLKRLVAIELKQGHFKAEYKGQMELYLRWLAKHEAQADEHPPLGIIMCTGKNKEQIELLELGKSGIHVAEYLTVLPPPEILQRKLHEAIESAQARLAAKKNEDTT
jgi:predicted nuclease of restriction endonuclease-like (RecB) superfamily